MAWSGGTYTKGNASTGGWTGDESNGIGIESGRHDTQDDDFAAGINSCLNKDGSNNCTGDLNFGGNKPVNIAAGTAAAPAICAGNDVNTGIFSPAGDQIGIATNGTEKVRIDASGKVGVGTTAPNAKLEVSGGNRATAGYATHPGTIQLNEQAITSINATGGLEFQASSFGSGFGSKIVGFDNGSLVLAVRHNSATWTESMRVDSSTGRVGIGTSSPGRRLHIQESNGAGGTNEMGLMIENTSTGNATGMALKGIRQWDTLVPGSLSVSSGCYVIRDETASADRFIISPVGHILVGTNSAGSNTAGCYYRTKVGSGTIWSHGPGTAGGGNVFYVLNDSTVGVQLNSGSTAWTAVSDQRVKKNIQELEYGLEEINRLRPIRFNYVSDELDDAKRMGFVAQDVLPIVPEVVHGSEEDTYSLANTDLIPTLVKAIQQLSAKVEALEARIVELEADGATPS